MGGAILCKKCVNPDFFPAFACSIIGRICYHRGLRRANFIYIKEFITCILQVQVVRPKYVQLTPLERSLREPIDFQKANKKLEILKEKILPLLLGMCKM